MKRFDSKLFDERRCNEAVNGSLDLMTTGVMAPVVATEKVYVSKLCGGMAGC